MIKPFHKRIAHHVRNYHKRITKYLYERDTILATAWIFIFILFVKIIPFHNIHFFDPMKLALEDFDINDIIFSKAKDPDKFDNRIVIINIGHADREGLAYIIEKAASMEPKVIGLDAFFDGPKEAFKDSLLRSVFKKTKNLVAVSRINVNSEEWKHHSEGSFRKDYFDSSHTMTGFANLTGEEGGTIRHISPYEKIDDSIHYSFAAMLVKQYSQAAFEKLKRRHDHNEIINYTRRNDQYEIFGAERLLNDEVDESYIKGKIVLLGYIGADENDIEDKFFTPMNQKFAGKSIPDMNGIVIHANMISMILDKNYINKLPLWIVILVAVLIGWLHMSFFIHYYLENHIWFHLVAKLAQLISAIAFLYLGGIFLFDKFRIKLDMSLTIIVIVLAVDIIYFYEAFAVWLHKKWGYKTVFHQKHH